MTRQHLAFDCDGDALVGTIDRAEGTSGLLIVTGGNEPRCGAFGGQSAMAARVAQAGFPVFRFDRRGVGDSEGENRGFRKSAPDIAAALAAFRRECPALTRVVGYGNCDAATALMLQSGAGCDALVLSNPWTFDEDDQDTMPAAQIRSRYARKLADPREWKRLLTGSVSLSKLAAGLRQAVVREHVASSLADEMRTAMTKFDGEVRYLVAGRDRTGLAFASHWPDEPRIVRNARADHAFSDPDAGPTPIDLVLSVLREETGEFDMGRPAKLSDGP